MDDLGNRIFYWVTDEANLSILLFLLVTILDGSSLVLFVVSSEQSVTRLEFLLLVAAMAVMFYMTLRNSTF